MEADINSLLRLESNILAAMMNVRYALGGFEAPAERDLTTIRNMAGTFVDLATVIHQRQVKEEEEYQREQGMDGA